MTSAATDRTTDWVELPMRIFYSVYVQLMYKMKHGLTSIGMKLHHKNIYEVNLRYFNTNLGQTFTIRWFCDKKNSRLTIIRH